MSRICIYAIVYFLTSRFSWVDGAGKYGGKALLIDNAKQTQLTFFLFNEPRALPSPDSYRVQAWSKPINSECAIALVLYDSPNGEERTRYELNKMKGKSGWYFNACDIPAQKCVGYLFYNIEISMTEGKSIIDGLELSASNSILTNGNFHKIEPKLPSNLEGSAGLPWGWRRFYSGASKGHEADGDYGITLDPTGNILSIKKGTGTLALSAEPMGEIEESLGFVARTFIEKKSTVAPKIILRQYGSKGLLQEDVSSNVSIDSTSQHATALVTTDLIERHPNADRILCILQFSNQEGACGIRLVEVCPQIKRK